MLLEAALLLNSEEAGQRLIPNAISGCIGGILVGYIVRRTGRYYRLLLFASCFPLVAVALIVSLDRQSPTFTQFLSLTPGV
jgi:hypothetical protein